jgi:hypothetical protein
MEWLQEALGWLRVGVGVGVGGGRRRSGRGVV